jgi:hypothetical protein
MADGELDQREAERETALQLEGRDPHQGRADDHPDWEHLIIGPASATLTPLSLAISGRIPPTMNAVLPMRNNPAART